MLVPFKSSVLRGAAWTVFGHGAGQLTRLASNLILTRLLFPEAFGLMAIVWMVLFALEMFSDVGIGPAVIRDEKGEDSRFLQTAFTVQVIRGGGLFLLACSVAIPLSNIYGEPALATLIPVAGLTALLAGFLPVTLHVERRRMAFKKITILELIHQISAAAAVITWAFFSPTIWALIGGALIGRLGYLVASHLWLPMRHPWFYIDRSSLWRILHLAKWILPASIFAFFSVQGDRMLLGYYLDMATLGVYAIAALLADAVGALTAKVNYGVALPAYGRVFRNQPHLMFQTYNRYRLGLDVLFLVPIGVLAASSAILIEFLYDSRYHGAGALLQILCLKLVFGAFLTNIESLLVASGLARYSLWLNAARTMWILVALPVGWTLFGLTGVIWAVALSELPVAVVLWNALRKQKLLNPLVELRSLIAALSAYLSVTLLISVSTNT